MFGRHELLVLLAEVDLALFHRESGTSTCSSRAVAVAILSKFSWVTAARLDVLIDDNGDEKDEREDEEREDDSEDEEKDERRLNLS